MRVERQLTQSGSDVTFGPPKTTTDSRTLSLDEQTVAVLRAHKSLKEVFSRLGHSTILITADIFAHISPELAKESAERLARLVRGEIALDGRWIDLVRSPSLLIMESASSLVRAELMGWLSHPRGLGQE